ncbi:CSMD [Mytilus edulis]|uniref:CSMD n=1 Tax=Mytilus edulis TaxID=6550 RepID=A0A8S3U8W8_MYTED|nr:CSMD [Mytilus edulis]
MTSGLYNFQLNFTEEAGIVKLSATDINRRPPNSCLNYVPPRPVVSCGFPSNTSNAVWKVDGLTERSIAWLNCTKGYYYPSDVQRTCSSHGNWSSVNISCIPYCGGPPSVPNATWLPDLEENGKQGTLRCKNGFYGKEIDTSCTDNDTWTEYDIHCYEECKTPDPVQNGKWNVSGFQNDSTAILTCNENYLPRSVVEIKCNSNGQWDHTNATCTIATTTETVGQTVETSSEEHSSAITTRELSTIVPVTQLYLTQNLMTSTPPTQNTSPVEIIQRSAEQTISLFQSISTTSSQTDTPSPEVTTLRSSPQNMLLSRSISSSQTSPNKTTQIPAAPTSSIFNLLGTTQPSTTYPSETTATTPIKTTLTFNQVSNSTKLTTESTTKHQTSQTSKKEPAKSSSPAAITISAPSRINESTKKHQTSQISQKNRQNHHCQLQ